MKRFQAIAAMAENRVIGNAGKIPWHLAEDFQWFKRKTTGHILVMGRKTFESIGKPLPHRQTIVLSRSAQSIPGVVVAQDLARVNPESDPRQFFICGGAQIYAQALPLCSDLYLTLVKRTVAGDTFFPLFEDRFELAEVVLERPEFKILHYRREGRV
jgi:dihydrofolate reductase